MIKLVSQASEECKHFTARSSKFLTQEIVEQNSHSETVIENLACILESLSQDAISLQIIFESNEIENFVGALSHLFENEDTGTF